MAEFCTEFGYDDFENNTHCLNPREDFPGFNETIALPEGWKNSKRFLQFIVSQKKSVAGHYENLVQSANQFGTIQVLRNQKGGWVGG